MAVGLSASGSGDKPGFKPVQYAHGIGSSADRAGIDGTSLDAVLQQLQTRVANTAIGQASIDTVQPNKEAAAGEVVTLTVDAASTGAAAIKDTWEAELIAGALRDVAAERGLPEVDNFLINTRLPDGSIVPSDSGFGNVARSQLFDTASDSQIATRIRSGLGDAGLTPISVSFVPVLQSAPVVIASSTDPAATVDASHLYPWWTKVLGDFNNYEGYYFELRDTSGKPFLISTAAHRAGSSSSWIRQDLRLPQFATGAIATGGAGG